MPKRDRFGIYAHVEDTALECVRLSIRAALQHKHQKTPTVEELRITLEMTKRLVRLCHEIGIMDDKKYFSVQEKIIEASKMAAGWLSYLLRNPAREGRGF